MRKWTNQFIYTLWRKNLKSAKRKAFSYVTSPLTGVLGRKKGLESMVSVSQYISAAAGATYPTSGYRTGFTEVVINWLRRPTALQNLLLLYLCKRVRILSSYTGNIMDHWVTGYFSSVTEESCF